MKFRLLVESDPKTDSWSAVFPDLPGCASCGDTEVEAIANAREALALWFEPHVSSMRAVSPWMIFDNRGRSGR